MIKFFRRIRQTMIKENKVSKYILYAVGEILLVVIGILIALQINNLNQSKNLSEKELGLLINLKNDIDILILKHEDSVYSKSEAKSKNCN